MSTIPASVGSSSGESWSFGPGGDQVQRDSLPIGGDGALHALFAPVNRGTPGDLAPAGRLGDGAIHSQVLQVQSDHLVVGSQRQAQQRPTVPGLGPRVQATTDGAVRAARAGQAFIAAAVHQGRDHVVEHHPVGNPTPMTTPRMRRGELRTLLGPDQGGELDPQRLDQRCW
jgi:hypothetical protein